MVDVTKENLISNIWKNFYDRLNSQVVNTSKTDTAGNSITLTKISSSFPDKAFETKSNYPILIVDTPTLSSESFTLGKTQVTGTIDCEIYTNQAEIADSFVDAIINAIETGKGTLADSGLHNVQVESTNSDMVERNSIKIHMRRVSFSFIFRYAKTRAY